MVLSDIMLAGPMQHNDWYDWGNLANIYPGPYPGVAPWNYVDAIENYVGENFRYGNRFYMEWTNSCGELNAQYQDHVEWDKEDRCAEYPDAGETIEPSNRWYDFGKLVDKLLNGIPVTVHVVTDHSFSDSEGAMHYVLVTGIVMNSRYQPTKVIIMDNLAKKVIDIDMFMHAWNSDPEMKYGAAIQALAGAADLEQRIMINMVDTNSDLQKISQKYTGNESFKFWNNFGEYSPDMPRENFKDITRNATSYCMNKLPSGYNYAYGHYDWDYAGYDATSCTCVTGNGPNEDPVSTPCGDLQQTWDQCCECDINSAYTCNFYKLGKTIKSPTKATNAMPCRGEDFKVTLSSGSLDMECQWIVNGLRHSKAPCQKENVLAWPWNREPSRDDEVIFKVYNHLDSSNLLEEVTWSLDTDLVDTDGDLIVDRCDICPETNYPENIDICKDNDNDAVPNAFDNCPDFPNAQASCINCMNDLRPDCCTQEDWNNDGIGDACDIDSDGIEDHSDNWLFYTHGYWLKELDGNTTVEESHARGRNYEAWLYSTEMGSEVRMTGKVGMKDSLRSYTYLSKYYCYCGYNEQHSNCDDHNSLCGPNHALPNAPAEGLENFAPRSGVDSQGKRIWNQASVKKDAYSSETPSKDNERFLMLGGVPEPNGTGVLEKSFKSYWDYQSQLGIQAPRQGENFTDYDLLITSGNYPMAKISYAPVTSQKEIALMTAGYLDANNNINFQYFKNYEQYQNGAAFSNNRHTLAFGMGDNHNVDLVVSKTYSAVAWFGVKYLPRAFWQMMEKYLPKPWEMGPAPWEYVTTPVTDNYFLDNFLRPGNVLETNLASNTLYVSSLSVSESYQQMFTLGGKNAIYTNSNGQHQIKVSNDSGFFDTVAEFPNGLDMYSSAVVSFNGSIFMAGNMNRNIPSVLPSSITLQDIDHDVYYEPVFVKISSNQGNLEMQRLPNLPVTGRFLNLFILNDKLYYITESLSGDVKIYLYNGNQPEMAWILKTEHTFASLFSLQNIVIKDGKAYFTVGDSLSNNTKMYSFDGATIEEYTTIPVQYDAAIRLFYTGDSISAVHINNLNGTGLTAWEISEEGIVSEKIIDVDLSGTEKARNKHCVVRNGNSVAGGQYGNYICEPFNNNHLGFYSQNEEVLSVEGKENVLYVGTETSIKVYDISDYTSPILLSEHLSAYPVWDMLVLGSYLYITDGNAISIFNINTPENIVLENTVVTYSDQNYLFGYTGPVYGEDGELVTVDGTLHDSKKLKMFNGKIYIADGHGITVLNVDNPANPEIEEDIFSSGNAETIDVNDDYIYLYDRSGLKIYETGSYDLFYADYDGKDCSNPTFLYDNDWYAGCGNGLYTIELDSFTNPWENRYSSLQGNRVYLEKPYIYQNISFYPNGYQILLETSDSVPDPACGNGFVEGGEVCELGSVIDCDILSNNYVSGTATCNNSCSEYNTTNCKTDDGW